ncbi:MAG: tetratricopeptide repeat protein [Candidatus Acidiferrales bacterium]
MDAVSYPNPEVIDFFKEKLVAVRVPHNAQPLAQQFKVKWTPTLVLLEATGEEHNRTVGFLPPEELIPSLLLGIGKAHFDADEFDEALASFDRVVEKYPRSDAAAEAVYLQGVSRYKKTKKPDALKQAHQQLARDYADSQWAKRASAYRLL